MEYSDTVEQSAEYLRRALPLMSKQGAALNPISYAVWYEYVSGANPTLKQRVDELTQNDKRLDERATVELFRRYVSEIDEDLAERFSDGFQKVMADMSQSAADAGDQAGQFGTELEKWSANAGAGAVDAEMAALLSHTHEMQRSIAALKSNLDESQREIDQLRVEVSRARQDAVIDGLTGLTNRKGFDLALDECMAEAAPGTEPSLLIADIDHFKKVNDTFGHVFGDKVIRTIAQILKGGVKGKDTAARYGGEEFVILLPSTPIDGAKVLAEQIRSAVERCRIKRTDSNEALASITLSFGVARFRIGEAASEFIARADAALYNSKKGGRNRVTLA